MNGRGKDSGKRVIYIAAFILLVAGGFVYKLFMKENYDGITVIKETSVSDAVTDVSGLSDAEMISSVQTQPVIQIYICGEVNNPGIYDVDRGTILNDVAELAGGFTDDAALDYLNLVYRFEDNMSVYIPGIDNLEDGDSVIMRNNENNDNSDGRQEQVNINTASESQLMTLPGIGEATANAIVQYRQGNPFTKPEDIMKVSGIGEAKYQKIRDLITI
ncbi:competence protein ComEA [Ruminococcaceae bacterium YRB3002]|nr:competence protein ComEA [Ruminococcaceae bacterium YRB3002]